MTRDKLFQVKRNIKGGFKFDENTAEVFDDMLRRSVPFYNEVQRMILELTKIFIKDKSNIYDLGCSTGTTLVNLTKNINMKNVNFIGMDYSPAMLEKAKIKLKRNKLLERCVLVNADLNKCFEIENASVVIMNLTLQFIRPSNRDSAISGIYNGLKKNGCFILVEKILLDNSIYNNIFLELYYDYKMRNNYSKLEISKKREALENILIPYRYKENLKLLEKSGFKIIDEFFRWYNFCGIIAVKN